jgi:hypothetical protein
MKKEVKLVAVFSMIFIVLISTYGTLITSAEPHTTQPVETTKLLCMIGTQKIIKEISVDTIDSIITLGESKKDAFLTIYNKYATSDEVTKAFEEVQPFFQALVENGLTKKSVEELNQMFQNLREIIKKPTHDPFGPQPCGSWNGLPTFLVGNAVCGVFCADAPAVGFTLGTHTIFPTIGGDVFITWAGSGETVSIGGLGFTTSTGPEFGLILGFIGVLIATPIMIVGGMFMTGFAALYLGIGPAPF